MSKLSFLVLVGQKSCARHENRDVKMKKFTLILSVVLGLTIGLKAQNYVGELHGFPACIPSFFTTSGQPFYVLDGNATGNVSIYGSDFITHIDDFNVGVNTVIALQCIYIDNYVISNYMSYSQNVFNQDDNFEYIVVNNIIDYITIKSSNGDLITHIYPDNGYYFFYPYYVAVNLFSYYNLIKTPDAMYLTIYETNYADSKFLLYQISQTQGLTKLDAELPISVFPTVANRGQQITVELGEGNNATEITVVNELGQVVKRVPVNGQSSITIPTTGLGSGLNILNTNTAKGNGGCKIIIK